MGLDDAVPLGVAEPNELDVSMDAAGGSGFAEESGGSSGVVPGLDKGYTGTNNQETAVDEGDIVKTDGAYIYILRGTSLLITTAWPADAIEVVATVDVEGNPQEMFVQDDTLVVFSSIWDAWAVDQNLGTTFGESDVWNLGKLTLLNIADRKTPQVVREVYIDGTLQSSRLVGQTARFVVASQIRTPISYGDVTHDLPFITDEVEPAVGGSSMGFAGDAPDVDIAEDREELPMSAGAAPAPAEESEGMEPGDEAGKADLVLVIDADGEDTTLEAESYEEAYALLASQAYAEKINALTLDQMLPKVAEVTLHDGGEKTIEFGNLASCEKHYLPSVEAGLNLVSVLSLDMAAPTEQGTTATVIGEGGQIYASANAIYIASNLWNGWLSSVAGALEEFEVTAIHKFDITTDGSEAVYAGTGKIAGSVLNQFSMSEFEGHLRIAHTRRDWNTGESDNRVSVLADNGEGQLEIVGALEDLAPGEDIYSARFMGEKGYVVTFETVDPLFTIDLSEPTNPTLVGELKIPGFSTYIHPMGDDHLLTIGQHTVENEWGGFWVEGIQLTIFDVSDFANPKQAHKVVLDNSAWSSAVYDSKAFTFHSDSGLLAIPLSAWGDLGIDFPGMDDDNGSNSEFQEICLSECEGDDDCLEECTMIMEEEFYYEAQQTVGLAVFSVDAEKGIHEHGFVDHSEFVTNNGMYWEEVRRSMVMGEHIYSIGFQGMKVVTAETVESVTSLPFPSENEFAETSGKEILLEEWEDVAVEEFATEEESATDEPVSLPASDA